MRRDLCHQPDGRRQRPGIAIRARLPNADETLRPGLFARLTVEGSRKQNVVVVPESAIVPRGTEFLRLLARGRHGGRGQGAARRAHGRYSSRCLKASKPDAVVITAGSSGSVTAPASRSSRPLRSPRADAMDWFEFCIRRPVFSTVLSLILIAGRDRVVPTARRVREYPNVDEPTVSVVDELSRRVRDDHREPGHARFSKARSPASKASTCWNSTSRSELSRITVRFRLGIDPDVAASDVRDRVSRVRRRLPDEIDEPTIAKVEADAQAIMYHRVPQRSHVAAARSPTSSTGSSSTG